MANIISTSNSNLGLGISPLKSGQGAVGSNWNSSIFTTMAEQQSLLPKELGRKYEIYDIIEDVLVLSCTWYRLRNTGGAAIIGANQLLDRHLFEKITEEDRVLASAIRDYYSKKIMVLKLKNSALSPFREDMNKFIHSDGKKFTENMLGLVYRLPQFYFYDTKIDEIFRGRTRKTSKQIRGAYSKKLTFVDSTTVNRRSVKRNEYWFTDEDDALVNLSLGTDNPLIKVWEHLIKQPIALEGLYYLKRRDDLEFYQVEKYKLAI